VFKISRRQPWPPHVDLTTARETLSYIQDDMKRVPELQKIADALEAVLHEIDHAEAINPQRIGANIVTASRFVRFKH